MRSTAPPARPWRRLLAAAATAAIALSAAQPAAAQDPAGDDAGPVVQTRDGAVRGITRTRYDAWLGLPYAAPPIGGLRWRPPQPAKGWSGVRDATRFGGRCVQGSGWDPGYEQPILNEDCLYLNVYAPHSDWADERRGRRPVFVWIHGGGFTGGAGQDTDPRKYVAQSGAVYVTINYRLGAMGFLNLPQLRDEGRGAGNYGLLDQQAALRWVRRNIARFGGDPDNVTIAGQSAGGSSVCDQLASPTARDLFDKAIIQSGGCSMTAQSAADEAGQAFLRTVGCAQAGNVLDCLRGKSPAELFEAQRTTPIGIRPSIGGRAFPRDPAEAVRTGRFNRVPVISGQVDNERSLSTFQNNDYAGRPITAERYAAMIRSTYGQHADAVLAEYPLSSYSSPSDAWAQMQSDAATYTRLQTERQIARWTPTYVYEFDEQQTPQFVSIYLLQWQGEPARSFPFGATHVDELGYLWEYLGRTLPFTDDELELSDQMVGYWSAFQYRSTPNAPYLPQWPPFSSSGMYMSLDACETAESSDRPPTACSQARPIAHLEADHNLDFWSPILG